MYGRSRCEAGVVDCAGCPWRRPADLDRPPSHLPSRHHRPARAEGRSLAVTSSISPKLLVWGFFGIGGRAGTTIGEVVKILRRTGLAQGTPAQVRRFVRRIIVEWENSRGRTHRELERVSAGRYRAVFNDREPRIGTMPARP